MKKYYKTLLDKWANKASEFMVESSIVSNYINQQICKKYITNAIRTGTLILPVNIEDRQYIVDFLYSKIYVGNMIKKHMFLAKEKNIGHWNYLPYIELYKNYSQQYEDIKLIFKSLDDYFNSKKIVNPGWNTIEAIDNVAKFITNSKNYYYHNEDKTLREFMYVINGKGVNYNKKCFDQMSINIFNKYIELYKSVLTSNSDNISISEDEFIYFRKILNFLSNFEMTQYLFSDINGYDYTKFYIMDYAEQYKYIKDKIKDHKGLYNKLCQEEKIDVLEQKYKSNYNELHDLFYSPVFFKFVLPEEFTINGDRILVQVSLEKTIDIIFLLENKDFFVYLPGFINNFLKRNSRYLNSNCFLSHFNCVKENRFYFYTFDCDKESVLSLIKLVRENKQLILKHIFCEMEKNLTKEDIKQVNKKDDEISLLDFILADQMDMYLNNLNSNF